MVTDTPTATPTTIPTDTPLPTDTPAPTDTPLPTDTPAPPTATPRPQPVQPTNPPPPPPPTNTPAPPPPADECAGIGGDGCKFKMRGGPAFAPNGGQELRLTFAFIHSGRNNEAQGSYFVWLEKEGVGKLPVSELCAQRGRRVEPGPQRRVQLRLQAGA